MTTALRPAPSARNVAFAVIRDVFGPDARGAAESLDRHLRKSSLDPRDRAFVTELAYGTIERRRWLDWQLEPYLGARAAKLPQMIAEILRLGTYQLRAMRVHEYAAVSESVQLARRFGHPGTAGLVNAVLRRVSTDPERLVTADDFPSSDDVLGTRASLPTWLVRMWRERFGDDRLDAIVDGVNGPAATGLSIDRRRATRAETIARLAEYGIAAVPSVFAADAILVTGGVPTPALREALGNRAELHSEAACFPVDLLDPQPGERILEACSGRGNKTLQIAGAIGAPRMRVRSTVAKPSMRFSSMHRVRGSASSAGNPKRAGANRPRTARASRRSSAASSMRPLARSHRADGSSMRSARPIRAKAKA
jgi:16S rRNA (cytosine967-C5)-methyltransferase